MRQRDRRSFGPGPYLAGLARTEEPLGAGHPFDVPVIAQLPELRFDQPVTLLAGENGTGKSTIVEALAAALGFADQGGELERSGQLPATPRSVLDGAFAPVLTSTKPRGGYFLRAESFFNVAAYVDIQDIHSPDLSLYGGRPLHQQSHGQSFLALASNRFAGDSIYILDEPEAALSVTSCLALLAVIARTTRAGAQFIIATHSPILLAAPGARLYELDDDGAQECAYDALDVVRLTRGFLERPDLYLRATLEADDDDA